MGDNEKTPAADASDEDVADEMKQIEENPPDKLEDWPDGPAKYKTMGGGEGESGYDEGPTSKLGPSNLRHHEDGKVTIDGEEVDNPEEYKGEPIPGGPTDPNAPTDPGASEGGDEDTSSAGSSSDDAESDRDTEGAESPAS